MTARTAKNAGTAANAPTRPSPSPGRSAGWGWIAAAVAAGLVLRLGVMRELADSPLFRGPLLDAAAYDRWARAIAAGDLRGEGVFQLAPLYPYLSAILYALAADGPLAVVLVQHLAGAAVAVGAGFFAGRLGGSLAGATAALLVAFHGPLVAHENALLPEVLGAVLLTGAVGLLALGAGGVTGLGVRRGAAAGFLLGLDALVRPTGLLLAAALLVWIVVRNPRVRRGRAGLAFAAGVILAVAPVTVRNRLVGGESVLITAGGGFNFYVGNHAGADGGYVQPEGVPFTPGGGDDFTGRAAAERDRGGPLTAGQVSRYWLDRGFAFIRAAPGRAFVLFLRKIALVWSRLEIPQIIDLASMREEAPLLKLAWVGAGLLMPLALLGLVIAYPRRVEREVLQVSLLGFTLATALFFVTDRYRIQAVPLLAVAAAGSVARIAELARQGKRAPLARALAGLAVAVVAVEPAWLGLGGGVGKPWVPPLHRALSLSATGGDSAAVEAAFAQAAARDPAAAPVFAHRGGWYRRHGRLQAARDDLERAVVLDRRDPSTWTELGLVWAMSGADSTAIVCFARARALDPGYTPASLALGQALLRQRRPQEALLPLRAAFAGVDSAAAHDALGVALILTGEPSEGYAHLERAVALAPERPDFALHLGLALADGGQLPRAARVLAAAVDRQPAYRPVRLALAHIALEQSDWEVAQREVEALLARDPGDREALAIRAELVSRSRGR